MVLSLSIQVSPSDAGGRHLYEELYVRTGILGFFITEVLMGLWYDDKKDDETILSHIT